MTYKLYFFNLKGRAEPTRMMLYAAGQKFEDITWTFEKWPEIKKTSPTGTAPWLEVNGQIIPESYAIHRFIANRFGFAGKDEFEKATVDAAADIFADAIKDSIDYAFVLRDIVKGNKDQMHKEKFIPALERAFPYIQGLIEKSGSGFLVPSGITWADMVIAVLFCLLVELDPNVENMFPVMAAHEKRVHNHPRIKDYVDSRKNVKVSFFSP